MEDVKIRFFYPTGSKVIPKRKRVFNKKTQSFEIETLFDKETGEVITENWYDYIQSAADSCNIRILFESAVNTDNLDLLKQRSKLSLDLTTLPDNLLDAQKQLQEAENYFNSLSIDEKNDFGNNFHTFISRQGKFSDSFVSSKMKINSPVVNNELVNNEPVNNVKDGE